MAVAPLPRQNSGRTAKRAAISSQASSKLFPVKTNSRPVLVPRNILAPMQRARRADLRSPHAIHKYLNLLTRLSPCTPPHDPPTSPHGDPPGLLALWPAARDIRHTILDVILEP